MHDTFQTVTGRVPIFEKLEAFFQSRSFPSLDLLSKATSSILL